MPKDGSFTDGQVITPDVCLGTAFGICRRLIEPLASDENASLNVPSHMRVLFQEAGATATRIAREAGWNGDLIINDRAVEL